MAWNEDVLDGGRGGPFRPKMGDLDLAKWSWWNEYASKEDPEELKEPI